MPIRRNLTITMEVFHHVYFHNGCVLSGSSLCDGPIHRPEQSYQLCLSLNVFWCNNHPLHVQVGRRGQT